MEIIARATLPRTVIEAARHQVCDRLTVPDAGYEIQRRRRETRIENLKKQFGWGDIAELEYRTEIEAARQAVAALPDPDKLLLFDRNRKVMTDMAESIAKATATQREELVRLLVEQVQAADSSLQPGTLQWVPAARPFFHEASWLECPQGDSNP